MGKLSDLWEELKTTQNDVRRRDLQKEITRIEKWMISRDIKEKGTETDWSKKIKFKSSGKCIHSKLDKSKCYFCGLISSSGVILADKCTVSSCGKCLIMIDNGRRLAKERGFY